MKELKLDCPDIEQLYFNIINTKHASITKKQLQIDESYLYSKFYFPIIIHSQNIFRTFEDSSILLEQLKLGNIHPKDIAFLYDNFNQYNNTANPVYKNGTCYYGVGVRPTKMFKDTLYVPDDVINKCRHQFYLPPIEQDRAKWKFMESNKMNYGWGYMGFRS